MPSLPASGDTPPARVFLIGMMGAGKTTIGRRLARRLGWPHLDSDQQVEAATGRTVPDILRTDGEAAFRAEEKQALRAAVESEPPVVVSVAGGAVLDEENREWLSGGGTVVWLRTPLAELTRRVADGRNRPLLEADPAATMARLYDARRSLYEALADVIVDNDLPPERVVDHIIEGIAARGVPC